jgi:hypothetical protein
MFLGIHSPTRRMILRTALDLYVQHAAVATGRGAAIPGELMEAVESMRREINAAESLNNLAEHPHPGATP